MSVKNFIPTVWSARLLANLDKAFVYPNAVNRDYEGEISQFGDTVKINQMGNVTVSDFTGVLADPEELTSSQILLTIDQRKSFNFKVEDVDKAQSNVSLIDKGMTRASVAVADVLDQYLATFISQATIKVGTSAIPIAITISNAYDTLVDLGVALNKKNVSKTGRFVIVPPEFVGLLQKDPRFTLHPDVLVSGVSGVVANFEIRESNNVPVSAGKYSIMAGTTEAISFAGQVTEVEAYRPEKGFSDAIKGLYVYGCKVVQPDTMACLTATFA
ncbi:MULTISPECIES: P22 phage major capsid protein family protein [Clostridium]|uniref:P22 phage major capsid protein family protein n=1 Tax=Clostridium frigoriphilum TaxID=443253 RepID=A0ABU7UUJ1_9CLOT|nr:P22 phage major capsid protein family protein [Clostridium sp. DSM 17811]MBU3098739.1 P22 coat protein - protein 5 domain protein [Clostridium sp. DSM 17811]